MMQPGWRDNPLYQPAGTVHDNPLYQPPNALKNPAAASDDDPKVLAQIASAEQGHAILARLALGDQTALAAAGIPAVLPYDTQVHEWGLGRDPHGGHHYLVRGGPGMVDWRHPALAGMDAIAHTHPYENINRTEVSAGLAPTLAEALAVWLRESKLPMSYMPGHLWYLFPSNQDLSSAYYTSHQISETVYTPFRLGADGWLSRGQGEGISVTFGPVRARLAPSAGGLVKSSKLSIDLTSDDSETNGLKTLEELCLQFLFAPMSIRAGNHQLAAGILQVDPLKSKRGRSPEIAWFLSTPPEDMMSRDEVHARIRKFYTDR